MHTIDEIKKVKKASNVFLSNDEKNKVLRDLSELLITNTESIIKENKKDLAHMDKENPMFDRLLLTVDRIDSIASDVLKVASLKDPVGITMQSNVMPNGLKIDKVTVPLGVVAVIYESRPNVTIDVFSLCLKSGNACILKGGKEASHSNAVFISIIKEALSKNNIDPNFAHLFSLDRDESKALLKANDLIDVCIPRGSKTLIDFVRQNATIPVIETGAGVVHMYFDLFGNKDLGKEIINNAKTRRVSVCNALDCLLIHKDRLDDLYYILSPLESFNVEIFADDDSYQSLSPHYPSHLLFKNTFDHYGCEFLSYKLAIKTVSDVKEAINHISHYTSKHSEAIITDNEYNAMLFSKEIDSAVIYINASTAFTDGGEFGMGAEIGISTQKLHARGPMGLEALTSYKWIVKGNGQTRP